MKIIHTKKQIFDQKANNMYTLSQNIWSDFTSTSTKKENVDIYTLCKKRSAILPPSRSNIWTKKMCYVHKKTNNVIQCPSTPKPLFKTHMCARWLSGCYLGDRCQYAHHVEDLFKPFYTQEMIAFYQRMIKLDINSSYMTRLCKEICDNKCENEDCLFFNNTSMSNKRLQVHMPSHSSMIPYCTITCNTCKSLKRVEIYSFTLLSS